MRKLLEKKCANCGRDFMTYDRNRIYCDVRCEDSAKDGIHCEPEFRESLKGYVSKYKVCLFCGERFRRRPKEFLDAWEARKYCCLSCSAKARAREKNLHSKKE